MSAVIAKCCAIIPVKDFAQAKQRFSPLLAPPQRAALARAMLEDVLAAATQSGFGRVVIVTADKDAPSIAASFGAHWIRETAEPSLNAAIETALRDDAMRAFDGAVVIPSDLPEATPDAINLALADLTHARGIAIVSSRDGGTNLLACKPPDALTPLFGPDSFARHIALARQAKLAVHVANVPALSRDIDTPDDLLAFMMTPTMTRTREYLLPVMRGLDPRFHYHEAC